MSPPHSNMHRRKTLTFMHAVYYGHFTTPRNEYYSNILDTPRFSTTLSNWMAGRGQCHCQSACPKSSANGVQQSIIADRLVLLRDSVSSHFTNLIGNLLSRQHSPVSATRIAFRSLDLLNSQNGPIRFLRDSWLQGFPSTFGLPFPPYTLDKWPSANFQWRFLQTPYRPISIQYVRKPPRVYNYNTTELFITLHSETFSMVGRGSQYTHDFYPCYYYYFRY